MCLAESRSTGDAPPTLVSTTAVKVPETALALRPGEDIEARGYFQESVRLLEYANGRVIATADDAKSANNDLSIIAKLKKAMEAKKREYLDPLKLQAEAIRDTYNYLMTPVLEADKTTRDKMLAYNAEQDRIRRKQAEINRLRIEAAQKEMELKGELTESVELVEVMPETLKRVSTDQGSSGETTIWKFEVIDFSLLPDAYKIEDRPQLTAIAKGHHDTKQIPGVRFYCEKIITVRAK